MSPREEFTPALPEKEGILEISGRIAKAATRIQQEHAMRGNPEHILENVEVVEKGAEGIRAILAQKFPDFGPPDADQGVAREEE